MEWNCGNDIAEIGWKKKIAICLWQCHCQNREVKKKNLAIVAIPLSKMGRKKKWFPKSGEELKKSATSTIFLQHFHNKLQVISYCGGQLSRMFKLQWEMLDPISSLICTDCIRMGRAQYPVRK